MFGGETNRPKTVLHEKIQTDFSAGFEFFNRQFQKLDGTPYAMSQGTSNFIAGGMASNGKPSGLILQDN
jgi:hypothetical protein